MGERDTGLDPEAIRRISFYFEAVRAQYRAFESDLRFGASEVYLHEMPGGQYANLYQQAHSLGVGDRWHEVGRMYAAVNKLFGDIVKVTPSSKVVGDMALFLFSRGIRPEDVVNLEPGMTPFPESVMGMFRGELGWPTGGWTLTSPRRGIVCECASARSWASRSLAPWPSGPRPASAASEVDFCRFDRLACGDNRLHCAGAGIPEVSAGARRAYELFTT
jgi:pyruvate carboxylase